MPSTICAIIPTFSRAAMLRECIDSILAQTRPLDQIIVVNDGSTDDTQNIVKSYGERVTLISKPNGGKSSAINLALPLCKTDYVWICDDDDIAAPDGAEVLAVALDADADAGFAFGTFKIFRDEVGERVYSPPTYWLREGEPDFHIQFLEEMFTFQFAMLVRRSLYEKTGPFQEDLIRSQDHEMAIRLARNAKPVYVPQVIFFQRVHEGQRGSGSASFASEANARQWLAYGQKMIAPIRKDYRLEEFTPTFARSWDIVRARRAALIERACICAGRALWDEAIADFCDAAGSSAVAPSPEKLRLAEAVIRQPLSWQMLGDRPDWIAGLRACYRMNDYGRRIIFAACRPLVWQARHSFQNGDVRGGIRRLRLMMKILGIRGMFSRVLSSLLA
jgi:GT2 family glycosyltransferase